MTRGASAVDTATPRAEPVVAVSTALSWALFVGGWLVLGALGRSTTALWFAGLGPVAAWLAVAGAGQAIFRARPPAWGWRASRAVLIVAAVTTAVCVAWCLRAGGAAGAWVAAIGWGVASCAASTLGPDAGIVVLPNCAVSAPFLAADASAWPLLGARWAMLPMMAGMAVASDWCAGIGLGPAGGVALHLAAMMLPVALWRGRRASPRRPLWVAALMIAGVVALAAVPGVRGWMAMSLLHALAWGLAWARMPAADVPVRPRPLRAFAPAAAVLALGATIAAFGLAGLAAVHAGLGLLSACGAATWIIARAWRPGHRHEES